MDQTWLAECGNLHGAVHCTAGALFISFHRGLSRGGDSDNTGVTNNINDGCIPFVFQCQSSILYVCVFGVCVCVCVLPQLGQLIGGENH